MLAEIKIRYKKLNRRFYVLYLNRYLFEVSYPMIKNMKLRNSRMSIDFFLYFLLLKYLRAFGLVRSICNSYDFFN